MKTLTLEKAQALAMQEFGTCEGLHELPNGLDWHIYQIEFGNLSVTMSYAPADSRLPNTIILKVFTRALSMN